MISFLLHAIPVFKAGIRDFAQGLYRGCHEYAYKASPSGDLLLRKHFDPGVLKPEDRFRVGLTSLFFEKFFVPGLL